MRRRERGGKKGISFCLFFSFSLLSPSPRRGHNPTNSLKRSLLRASQTWPVKLFFFNLRVFIAQNSV